MSGTPPQLPPAALAGHQAAAHIDRVAVRIINLPNGIRDGNVTGTKLSGTVTGTKPDGSVDVRTDKGTVTIALRDRGSLPVGARIDIEIPAGNNPQKASIAADKSPPPHIQKGEGNTSEKSNSSLQIKQNLSTQSLGSVITNTSRNTAQAQLQAMVEAPIEAGQTFRFAPLPTTQPMGALTTPLYPADTADVIATLTNLLQNTLSSTAGTPLTQTARATLANLLTQILQNIPTNALPSALIKTAETTLQSLTANNDAGEMPTIGQPGTPPNAGAGATTASQIFPTAPHMCKPLLGQITGFVGSPFAAATPALSVPIPAGQGRQILTPTTITLPLLPAAPQGPATTTTSPATTPLLNIFSGSPTPNAATFIGQYQGNVGPQGQPVVAITLPASLIAPSGPAPLPQPQNGTASPVSMSFALPVAPTNIPVGSTVIVTLANDTDLQVALPPTTTTIKNWFQDGAGMQSWDTLDGIIGLLAQSNPAQASGFARLIPTPMTPQTIGPLSLFFLSMVRSGDVENWIGREAIATLRQSARGSDLLRLLSGEARLLRQTEATALPQDWRATTIPFHFGHHIQKLPVYYKRSDDDGATKDKEQRARRLRFLFDLQMTRMGAVQIDGFLQSQAEKQENQRLDIILRTKHPLSVAMQSQMKRIYAGATEKSRLTGDLSFQFRPEQWVTLDLGANAFDDVSLA